MVVSGALSQVFGMEDMIYQGTVLGPPLWNVFFSDSASVLRSSDFQDVYFADDLNAFKEYEGTVSDTRIFQELGETQGDLHRWGMANQVAFDAASEVDL